MLLIVQPILAPLAVGLWWLVTKLTGKAAVGSVIAVAFVPIGLIVQGRPAWEFLAVAGLCGLIVVKHSGNIVRADSARRALPSARVDDPGQNGPRMQLLTPLTIGSRTAPNRVVFGPHVTNLGADDRSIPERHIAYYERRARGGCGTIVVEGASVHPSDWPYERSPLAERCADGWAAIVAACRPHGSLVIASLDHAGGQGSSAYNQAPLWAPSRVPEVNSREVPKWMEPDDIAAVVDGFATATKLAVEADLDGVEINAGQHSLVRQFLSGLTNQRDDEWGHDRLLFARQVIEAARGAAGDRIVGLRLSCDELAPWAGITPEMAPEIAVALVGAGLDYLVVTRGSIYTVEKTRPDFHEPTGFNIDLCRSVRTAIREAHPDVPGAPAGLDRRGRPSRVGTRGLRRRVAVRRSGDDPRPDRRPRPRRQTRRRRR